LASAPAILVAWWLPTASLVGGADPWRFGSASPSQGGISYTASWRRFLTRGEAGGLLGGLIVIAICALVVVPVGGAEAEFRRAIAPLGPSLLIGAFSSASHAARHGCGLRHALHRGGGSGRMLFTLAFFVIGSVLGSLSLAIVPGAGGIDPILASIISAPGADWRRRSPVSCLPRL